MPFVVDIDATYRDEDIVAFYQPSPLVVLPVVNDVCWYCQEKVWFSLGEYTASRIDGDSRHGYEPCHKACSVAVAAEIEAGVLENLLTLPTTATIVVSTSNNDYTLHGGYVTGGILGNTYHKYDKIERLELGRGMLVTREGRQVLHTSPVVHGDHMVSP